MSMSSNDLDIAHNTKGAVDAAGASDLITQFVQFNYYQHASVERRSWFRGATVTDVRDNSDGYFYKPP
ncbi:uncharacterized protein A4U43_C08F32190 [Asparagus officinalis]|nr:uncharacterized protein A4U43_C08F32190 [Asparagus officinalis]